MDIYINEAGGWFVVFLIIAPALIILTYFISVYRMYRKEKDEELST